MAAPTRIFVGVFVFSLIASLAVVPFTFLVLTGYQPPASIPLVEPETPYGAGHKMALVLASLFCLGFVVMSWRALLGGARRDAQMRKERMESRQAVEVGGDGGTRGNPAKRSAREAPSQRSAQTSEQDNEQPPGYG